MKSSLKKLVSLMLVVVMIITTNNFNSFSLTLDTLVRNEIEINKERNKDNKTKYYEEFLSEKKQYLLNDEGNASKATTKNNDIDKTVKDYLVDGNMENINKDIESYIENNKSSNDTVYEDIEEDNFELPYNVDMDIENNDIENDDTENNNTENNVAENDYTTHDEFITENDKELEEKGYLIADDGEMVYRIDSNTNNIDIEATGTKLTNATYVGEVSDKLNNDTENTEITAVEDSDMGEINDSQTFGAGNGKTIEVYYYKDKNCKELLHTDRFSQGRQYIYDVGYTHEGHSSDPNDATYKYDILNIGPTRFVAYWVDRETGQRIDKIDAEHTDRTLYYLYPVFTGDLSNLKVGDTVNLYYYEQSNNGKGGYKVDRIAWLVTAINGGASERKVVTLLSKKVIDVMTGYETYPSWNWYSTAKERSYIHDFDDVRNFNTRDSKVTFEPCSSDFGPQGQNWLLDRKHHDILEAPATDYAKNKLASKFWGYYDFCANAHGWARGMGYWVAYNFFNGSRRRYDTHYYDPYMTRTINVSKDKYYGARPVFYVNLDALTALQGSFTTPVVKSKISWNRDGGEWKDKNYQPISEYEEGKKLTLPNENQIVKNGYKLEGWYINSNRTTAYKELPTTIRGAITLTAKWTKTITQYKINWQLKGGKFKEEYKHYETDKHTDTEDFVLPTENMLNPPYGKIFKEWMVEGVATTSIAKEIKKDVTVEVNWAKSTGSFESFNIGTYKTTIEDTEEEADLDWLILDKKDDKLLLMTKNVIDNVSYDKNGNANFKNSSIKKWLNNDFYDKTFDDKQKRNIFNDKNNGKVFLLTKEQFNEYFATNMQSLAEATEYAGSVNNGGEKLDLRGSLSPYWLMATEGTKVPYVQNDGILNESGIEANAKTIGVRPCIWVEEKKMDEVSVFDVGKFFRSLSDTLKPFFARFFGIIW